jgi:hypothetical protein
VRMRKRKYLSFSLRENVEFIEFLRVRQYSFYCSGYNPDSLFEEQRRREMDHHLRFTPLKKFTLSRIRSPNIFVVFWVCTCDMSSHL